MRNPNRLPATAKASQAKNSVSGKLLGKEESKNGEQVSSWLGAGERATGRGPHTAAPLQFLQLPWLGKTKPQLCLRTKNSFVYSFRGPGPGQACQVG